MDSSKRLSTIVEKLERLQQKVQQLNSENEDLRAVNKTLSHRLQQWQKEQVVAEQNILEHAPAETVKQQRGVQATSNQDIRQQIDHYLSEIDKCIEWLREQ